MLDRIKYHVFHFLWSYWHMWNPRFFTKLYRRTLDPDKNPEDAWTTSYKRKERWGETEQRLHHWHKGRPWWHMCCNGNAGGWRTKLCDWMECKWRFTDYYSRPPEE